MSRPSVLRRRIIQLTWVFILGLVVSGVTALPLPGELNWLARILAPAGDTTALGQWLVRVRDALAQTQAVNPFLFYGTDWLAFGHFVIAIAFIGALRDPVRNRWLFDFGLIACALVIPYAMIFGACRGIPVWWRLVDGTFGMIGFIPLWYCRRWARELETACRASHS